MCEISLTDMIQAVVNIVIFFTRSILFSVQKLFSSSGDGGGSVWDGVHIKMKINVWLKDPESKRVQCDI